MIKNNIIMLNLTFFGRKLTYYVRYIGKNVYLCGKIENNSQLTIYLHA